jgi:hypothetical protein
MLIADSFPTGDIYIRGVDVDASFNILTCGENYDYNTGYDYYRITLYDATGTF